MTLRMPQLLCAKALFRVLSHSRSLIFLSPYAVLFILYRLSMSLLFWFQTKSSSVPSPSPYMALMIFKVIAFLTLISAVCAQHALIFTDVPDSTGIVVGNHYNVDWTGGDYSSVTIYHHPKATCTNRGIHSPLR